MDGFSSNQSWPENHFFRLDEFSRNRSKSPSKNWKFGNIIGWIFQDISKSVKRLESYDDQWFWFRWSNVKLILSWDSRIIPNKNFQIRIDYFLSHTFKRNYQFEFREKSDQRIYRLIHGKCDPLELIQINGDPWIHVSSDLNQSNFDSKSTVLFASPITKLSNPQKWPDFTEKR